MLPPMGFLGSALNMPAPPSTHATTWFVITTATPNSSAILSWRGHYRTEAISMHTPATALTVRASAGSEPSAPGERPAPCKKQWC
jgi:hypothetical protein